jgi:hypothetical protein
MIFQSQRVHHSRTTQRGMERRRTWIHIKMQKLGDLMGKKNKWGSVLVERRSSRIRNDGGTSLEKASGKQEKRGPRGILWKR